MVLEWQGFAKAYDGSRQYVNEPWFIFTIQHDPGQVSVVYNSPPSTMPPLKSCFSMASPTDISQCPLSNPINLKERFHVHEHHGALLLVVNYGAPGEFL
jgi:hypothetical protein